MELTTTSLSHLYDAKNPRTERIISYTNKFLNLSRTSTRNTVQMCEVLYEAKQTFEEYEFYCLCREIGYDGEGSSSIKKFLRIGACAQQFQPYLDNLPNSWTTLYEITQLEPEVFLTAMEQGKINSASLGKDIRVIAKAPYSPIMTMYVPYDPKITISFGSDVDKNLLNAIYKEIEALKLDFKFEVTLNKSSKEILGIEKLHYV